MTVLALIVAAVAYLAVARMVAGHVAYWVVDDGSAPDWGRGWLYGATWPAFLVLMAAVKWSVPSEHDDRRTA